MITAVPGQYSKSFICTDKENNAEIVNQGDLTKPTSTTQLSNISNILTTSNQSLLIHSNNNPNSQSQKFKRNYISQKSLPLNTFNETSKVNIPQEVISHSTTTNMPHVHPSGASHVITTQTQYNHHSSTTSGNYISQNGINSNLHNNNNQSVSTNAAVPNSSSSSSYTSINHSRTEENLRELAKKMNADKVKRNLNCQIPDDNSVNAVKDHQLLHQQPIKSQQNSQTVTAPSAAFANVTTLGNGVKILMDQDHSKQTDKHSAFENNVAKQGDNGQGPTQKYLFKDQENKNLIRLLSNTIIEYVRRKQKETTPFQCLSKHNIPTNLRAQMVDWMIEVLSSYKCSEQTFFIAVRIMDLYFARTTQINEVSDLHLVGVTSMFIACQYEEIYPMKLAVVHEKIAHKKLSIDQIKKKESEILSAIQFNIIGTTPYQITSHVLLRCNLKELLETKVYAYLEKICIYLAKMILYDYDLIYQKEFSLLSGALIYVAYKIIEQIDPSFVAVEKIKEVMKILTISNDPLIETAAQILNLAQNFDKVYPNLENLQQFNVFSLQDSQKQQQQQSSQSQQL